MFKKIINAITSGIKSIFGNGNKSAKDDRLSASPTASPTPERANVHRQPSTIEKEQTSVKNIQDLQQQHHLNKATTQLKQANSKLKYQTITQHNDCADAREAVTQKQNKVYAAVNKSIKQLPKAQRQDALKALPPEVMNAVKMAGQRIKEKKNSGHTSDCSPTEKDLDKRLSALTSPPSGRGR